MTIFSYIKTAGGEMNHSVHQRLGINNNSNVARWIFFAIDTLYNVPNRKLCEIMEMLQVLFLLALLGENCLASNKGEHVSFMQFALFENIYAPDCTCRLSITFPWYLTFAVFQPVEISYYLRNTSLNAGTLKWSVAHGFDEHARRPDCKILQSR